MSPKVTNLRNILYRVQIGFQRGDVSSSLKDIVNNALKELQDEFSFTFMRQAASCIMKVGQATVRLPLDLKELDTDPSPIGIKTAQYGILPCLLYPRGELERLRAYSGYPQSTQVFRQVSMPIYIDWQDGKPTINIVSPAGQNIGADADLEFVVNYFRYLPTLEGETDHNLLTDMYPELVIAKAKATAFAAVGDPLAETFEKLAILKMKLAKQNDAYKRLAGRRKLM